MSLPRTRYIDAGPGLPQASSHDAEAKGWALSKLGATIAQVGDKGFQIAGKVRRMDEAGKASAFFANLDEEASQFSIGLMKRNDPEAWAGEWKERVEGFKSRAKDLGLSPEGMAHLNLQVQDWSTQRTIRFETQAAQRAVMEGKARLSNSLNYYASRGDTEGMQREMGRMEDAGFSPSEIEQAGRETERLAARSMAEREIEEDPGGALERLDSESWIEQNPGATLDDQARLKRQAESALEERRGSEVETMETLMSQGKLTGADIEAAEYLSDKDKRAFGAAMQRVTADDPPTNAEHGNAWKVLDVVRAARKNPAITDEQFREIYNEARTDVLQRIPPAWQGDLKKELNYLSPAARNPNDPSNDFGEYKPDELQAMGRDVAFRARDAGVFGDISKEAPFAVREKAYRKAEDIRLEVARYVKSTPEAGPDQVREFTDRLVSGDRAAEAGKSIKLPGAGFRLRLPSLPVTKGRQDDPLQVSPGPTGSTDALLPNRDPADQLDKFLE